MLQNVGSTDKVVRIMVGIALLSLLFFVQGNARYWGLIGILPIVTALMSWCPAYTLFGIKTCPAKSRGADS